MIAVGGRGGSSGMSSGRANLPDLQGTEKQIAYAKDIRKNFLERVNSEVTPKLQKNNMMKSFIGQDINILTGQRSDGGGKTKYQLMMKEFEQNNPKPNRSDKEAYAKWKDKKSKVEEKYEKWLKTEFYKKLKSIKSAKWWIDNKR